MVQLSANECFRLLNFEGTYQTCLSPAFPLGPAILETAQFNPLAGESLFPARLSYWECDPFNHVLIESEPLNAMAALRAHHKFPKPFGDSQTWLVWVTEFRGLVRYQVSGDLGALRQNYPDLVSCVQMRDAGLDVSALKNPRAILRIR